MTQYQILFDLASCGYRDLQSFTTVAVLTVLSLLAVVNRQALAPRYPNSFLASFVPWAGLIFSATILFFLLATSLLPYLNYKAALQNGNYLVAEGELAALQMPGSDGVPVGGFSVDGMSFSYRNYANDPGLRTSSLKPGSIRAGMRVKVYYSRGIVLRLEAAQ